MADEPTRTERPRENLPEAVKAMVTVWQGMAEAASDIAASRRTLFLAYVGEGFSEAQALELVKTV